MMFGRVVVLCGCVCVCASVCVHACVCVHVCERERALHSSLPDKLISAGNSRQITLQSPSLASAGLQPHSS